MSYFETLGISIEAASGYRLLRARPLIPDTNVLLNDVVRFARTGKPTALATLGELGAVRLYAPNHVRAEVDEHLRTFAKARRVSPDVAQTTWEARYLPVVRWVDASSLPTLDPRVGALSRRDSDDVPTAKLALLLGVASLSGDDDLVAVDLASGLEWLGIVLGARTLTYTELGGAVSLQLGSVLLDEILSALGRMEHRDLAKGLLAGMAVAGALALLLRISGKGGEMRLRTGYARAELVDVIQDVVGRILSARDEAAAHVRRIELAEVGPLSDTQRLARVLASAFEPLPVNTLRELLPDLTAQELDQLLQSNSSFGRGTDGRWELGQRHVALRAEPSEKQDPQRYAPRTAVCMRVPTEPFHLRAALLTPRGSLGRDHFVGTASGRMSSHLWAALKPENLGWTWQGVQRATRLNRSAFVKWAEGEETWSWAFASFADRLKP